MAYTEACKRLLCETKTWNVLTRNDNDKHYDYNTNNQPHLKETPTKPVNKRVKTVTTVLCCNRKNVRKKRT